MTTITPAMEDYLKTIYLLDESGERVTTQAIAERLDVAAPSVTGMVKRLDDLNLVEHERYRSITLTESGRKVALEIVRHHRLLELWLVLRLRLLFLAIAAFLAFEKSIVKQAYTDLLSVSKLITICLIPDFPHRHTPSLIC